MSHPRSSPPVANRGASSAGRVGAPFLEVQGRREPRRPSLALPVATGARVVDLRGRDSPKTMSLSSARRPPRSKRRSTLPLDATLRVGLFLVQAGVLPGFAPRLKRSPPAADRKTACAFSWHICIVLRVDGALPGSRAGGPVPPSATPTSPRSRSRCGRPGRYSGTVDGLRGPGHRGGSLAFQERVGLVPDGIAGPRTKRALGDLGGPELGARPLSHRHARLGRRRAPVQACLARLPIGAVRRRLRPAPRRSRSPVPALRRPADDRHRGPEDDGGARRSAAHEPSRAQRAGLRAGG